MDEATASVDSQTDAVIQRIIRVDFAACTIISIAHRIPTVMDCERVLVIDAGECSLSFLPYHQMKTLHIHYSISLIMGKPSTKNKLFPIKEPRLDTCSQLLYRYVIFELESLCFRNCYLVITRLPISRVLGQSNIRTFFLKKSFEGKRNLADYIKTFQLSYDFTADVPFALF